MIKKLMRWWTHYWNKFQITRILRIKATLIRERIRRLKCQHIKLPTMRSSRSLSILTICIKWSKLNSGWSGQSECFKNVKLNLLPAPETATVRLDRRTLEQNSRFLDSRTSFTSGTEWTVITTLHFHFTCTLVTLPFSKKLLYSTNIMHAFRISGGHLPLWHFCKRNKQSINVVSILCRS